MLLLVIVRSAVIMIVVASRRVIAIGTVIISIVATEFSIMSIIILRIAVLELFGVLFLTPIDLSDAVCGICDAVSGEVDTGVDILEDRKLGLIDFR